MHICNAQTEFRPGYIVLKDKDTLFGEIDYRSDKIMARVCKFKKDKTVLKYSPFDIESYRFTDGKYFVSKKVNGKSVFLQFLIEGRLNVYYYQDDKSNDSFYFLENEKGDFKEIPYKEEVVLINGKYYDQKSLRYKGFLTVFTAEAPELQSEINAIEKPGHDNLIKLAKDYHNSVCDTEKCIVYEAKHRKSKVSLEMQAGVFKFTTNEITESVVDKTVSQVGVIAHFSIPSLGDKWYLKTGLLHSKLSYSNTSESMYTVPFHIEYIHFKGRVRPKFSYGPNFNEIASTSLNVGVNVQLSESFFWSINTSLDFKGRYLFLPGKSIGGSVNTGLFIKNIF